MSCWLSNTTAGASIIWLSAGTAEVLHHRTAGAGHHFGAAVMLKRLSDAGDHAGVERAGTRLSRHASWPLSSRVLGVAVQPKPATVCTSSCSSPCCAARAPPAACRRRPELVDVGRAVRVMRHNSGTASDSSEKYVP